MPYPTDLTSITATPASSAPLASDHVAIHGQIKTALASIVTAFGPTVAVRVIFHAADAGVARVTADWVVWIGTVTPTNMAEYDLFIDIT